MDRFKEFVGLRPVVFGPGTRRRTRAPVLFPFPVFGSLEGLARQASSYEPLAFVSLAYVFVPVFQVLLDFGHEAAGVGSVDDAVIEAQG